MIECGPGKLTEDAFAVVKFFMVKPISEDGVWACTSGDSFSGITLVA